MRTTTTTAALALLLAACSTGTDTTTTTTGATPTSDPTTTSTPVTSSTTTTLDATNTTTAFDGSTGTVTSEAFPSSGDTALLDDVEVATAAGLTTITLSFENDVPLAYEIGYVEPPIREDASGRQVDLAGDAFLEMTIAPGAGVDLSDDTTRETYEGEDRFSPNVPVVEEIAETGDFESVLTWVVGLDGRRPFTVTTLDQPSALQVTIGGEAKDGSTSMELGADPATCTNADGFSISHPRDWWVNDGSVTTACGTFAPSRIDLEPGTDISGPISAFVDPVPFADATATTDGEISRSPTTIDGRRAVRVVTEVSEGLYPTGTEVTTWMVDIGGPDDDRTLLLTTADTPAWDYDRNQAVLDAMARSLVLHAPGSDDARTSGNTGDVRKLDTV